jgi:hypothetical protein
MLAATRETVLRRVANMKNRVPTIVCTFTDLGSFVNSETGHSEDQQPNLRHALGSVKRVKVRATGDLVCLEMPLFSTPMLGSMNTSY